MFWKRPIKSIRGRLTLELLLGSYLIFLVFGSIFYLALRNSFTNQFNAAQLASASALIRDVERKGRWVEFDLAEDLRPRFATGADSEYFQIQLSDGVTLARSDSLGAANLSTTLDDTTGQPEFEDLRLPDGRSGRIVTIFFSPVVETDAEDKAEGRVGNDESPLSAEADDPAIARELVEGRDTVTALLLYATPRAQLDEVLDSTLVSLLLIGLMLPLGMTLLVGRVTDRGLLPVSQLAEEIRSVDARKPGHRFTAPGRAEELEPLVRRLNELLGKVESTVERERRFAANAAHELRTPVAELRVLAEVSLQEEKDGNWSGTSRAGTLQDVREIGLQMEKTVNTLLHLSRTEKATRQLAIEPVDLGEILRESVACFHRTIEERRIDCRLQLPPPLQLQTDLLVITSVVQNVLSNAISYAPEGSWVECTGSAGDTNLELTIRNRNSTLTEEDIEHLSQPFWRKAWGRPIDHHSGLGLALVNAYMDLLGGEVSAGLSKGGDEFFVKVRLPVTH